MNTLSNFMQRSLIGLILFATIICANAGPLSNIPPQLKQEFGAPMSMINLSRDHQLFYKAYNEYTDFDGDGAAETQYKNTVNYFGYFDNTKCYNYSSANQRFEPQSITLNHLCAGNWSGNFLNWASMTRIDTVRKILYGGYRSTDTNALTVLERTHLPTDAHSFAKYYKPDATNATSFPPISSLTPFNVTEISMCNTTLGSNTGTNQYSHTNTNPPLLRVANGNFSLWNSNERWQCYWNEEKNASNGNDSTVSGINASANNPSRNSNGLSSGGAGPDYIVRVVACDPNLLGAEKCKTYPSGNRKPIGVMQENGDNGLSEFGLFTGSFQKNISGGVLRRNITDFSQEVNVSTDGTFTNTQGIVYTINRLRIYGYNYQDGNYTNDLDNGGAWCTYQLVGLYDGACASWGNPISEMYLESLRYLAGQAQTAAFDYGAGSKDAAEALTKEVWVDPFRIDATRDAKYGKSVCRPINVINFNASVSSYDGNQLGGFSDINPGGQTAASMTDRIGNLEGITGTSRYIGRNGTNNDDLCTAKNVPGLSSVLGLCPEAPSYEGSYQIAGIAYHAHVNPIRTDIPIPPGNSKAFRVNTYGIALATSAPRLDIPVPGTSKIVTISPAYRLITGGGQVGGGTLVDFRVVSQDKANGTGKFVIQWEDSEQGGDYDQDVWGTLEYRIYNNGTRIDVTTYAAGAATANPQGFGYIINGTQGQDGPHFHSGIIGFNFNDPANINVVTTNAVNNGKLNGTGGCNNCQVRDTPTVATYTIGNSTASSLKDPLYYAAKYGNFTDSNNDGIPNGLPNGTAQPGGTFNEWAKNNSVTNPTDPNPDGYIYAIDPAELDKAITAFFGNSLQTGITAPAVTSTQLNAGDLYFTTQFRKDFSGDLIAYDIGTNGQLTNNVNWQASQTIKNKTPAQRVVLTMDSLGVGKAFRWNQLDALLQYQLNIDGSNNTPDPILSPKGSLRLDYLRGDQTQEAASALPNFRARPSSILGSMINSSPWVMGAPSSGYSDADYPGYQLFRSNNFSRKRVIFVGANDGMLHGFNVDTAGNNGGELLMSYVPRRLYPNLTKLTAPNYVEIPYVDGSPFVGDININGTTGGWRSYLFSSLGRGGQGIFALDVTNPSSYTESAANAAAIARWEFTDQDDPDLGNILARSSIKEINNQPRQIVRMQNNRWAVIYGNGYKSETADGNVGNNSGQAALFILFVNGPSGVGPLGNKIWISGTDYVKIPVGPVGYGPDSGLGAPTAVDSNKDGSIDIIYAADLKGNIWKFDVSTALPGGWKVAHGTAAAPLPLYTATTSTSTPLPITSALGVTPHPFGGYMINFGTGKALEATDLPTVTTQTYYGIWDRPASTSPLASGRARLQQQTASLILDASSQAIGIRTSNNKITNWTNIDGWYMDLIMNSESVIYNPYYISEDAIAFQSIFLSNISANGCGVFYDGSAYLMNAIDGSSLPNTFDLNGDGVIDQNDVQTDASGVRYVASGIFIRGGSGDITKVGGKRLVATSGTGSVASTRGNPPPCATGLCDVKEGDPPRTGRIFWRELIRNQ